MVPITLQMSYIFCIWVGWWKTSYGLSEAGIVTFLVAITFHRKRICNCSSLVFYLHFTCVLGNKVAWGDAASFGWLLFIVPIEIHRLGKSMPRNTEAVPDVHGGPHFFHQFGTPYQYQFICDPQSSVQCSRKQQKLEMQIPTTMSHASFSPRENNLNWAKTLQTVLNKVLSVKIKIKSNPHKAALLL